MKNASRILVVLLFLIASVPVFPTGKALATIETALDWTGYIDGAPYRIRVPENWNGTLLVFARGYTLAVVAPPDVAFGGAQVIEDLLEQGYALAASGYQSGGWAVKEGVHDTLVLTNFFREQIGEPEHIILYGMSMGGLITAESIEKFPGIYDAGIPMCAPLVGAPEFFDHLLNIGLAYDVTFGWPSSWGEVEDVRDQVSFYTDVLPVTYAQTLNPALFGLNEFVRLVNNLPQQGYYLQLNQGYGFWLVSGLMVYARAEIEARANGSPVENTDQIYSLSDTEQAYLAGLGVDSAGLLAAMNARTNIDADQNARNYVEHYTELTGRISQPVLTMHTIYDVATPVEMESAYFAKVAASGRSENLVQVFTTGASHCAFTGTQLLAAVQAVESWLESGIAPDEDFFSSADGFDTDYEPAGWQAP